MSNDGILFTKRDRDAIMPQDEEGGGKSPGAQRQKLLKPLINLGFMGKQPLAAARVSFPGISEWQRIRRFFPVTVSCGNEQKALGISASAADLAVDGTSDLS